MTILDAVYEGPTGKGGFSTSTLYGLREFFTGVACMFVAFFSPTFCFPPLLMSAIGMVDGGLVV